MLNSFAGPNGPDIVVQFMESAASEPGTQSPWKGDHGGIDWESQHIPLVMAGPGVRSGVVSDAPARLIDIAPTLLTLMGIKPSGMTGIPLADALRRPTAAQRAAERRTDARLLRVVHALQAEARADITAEKLM